MKALIHRIVRIETGLYPIAIVAIVFALNIGWTLALQWFDTQFRAVSGGLALLDLQNVQGVLSPEAALALISGYTPAARAFYWLFFVADCIVPLLSFGSFALLWAALLRRIGPAFYMWVQQTPLLLIPLGVGIFDIFENVLFVVAIQHPEAATALLALQIGTAFVWLKVACLFTTFGLTPVLLIGLLVATLRRIRA